METEKKNPLDSINEVMTAMKEMKAENIRLSNLKERTTAISTRMKEMADVLLSLAKELNPAVTMSSTGTRNLKPVVEVLAQKLSEGCNITNTLITATIYAHGIEEKEQDTGYIRSVLKKLPGVEKGGEYPNSYLFMKGT